MMITKLFNLPASILVCAIVVSAFQEYRQSLSSTVRGGQTYTVPPGCACDAADEDPPYRGCSLTNWCQGSFVLYCPNSINNSGGTCHVSTVGSCTSVGTHTCSVGDDDLCY
jgi:hypothetical protein